MLCIGIYTHSCVRTVSLLRAALRPPYVIRIYYMVELMCERRVCRAVSRHALRVDRNDDGGGGAQHVSRRCRLSGVKLT